MKTYKIGKYKIEANSPVEAVKICKLLDSNKMKDGYYWNDIRQMCVKHDWYTRGTNSEYNNLFDKATKGEWNADDIALDIYRHSDGVPFDDIYKEVKKLHIYDSTIRDSWLSEQSKQQFNKIIEADKRAEKAGQAKFAGDKTKYEFMKEKMMSNKAKFKIGDIVELTFPKMIAKIIDVQFLPEYYYDNSAWRYLLKVIDAPNTYYKPGDEYKFAVAEYEMKKSDKKSFNDSTDVDYLTKEEEKAINDYRQAIVGTNNPKLLELYKHILEEEIEHKNELQKAKTEDAIKDDRSEVYLDDKWFKVKQGFVTQLGEDEPQGVHCDIKYNGLYSSSQCDDMMRSLEKVRAIFKKWHQ